MNAKFLFTTVKTLCAFFDFVVFDFHEIQAAITRYKNIDRVNSEINKSTQSLESSAQ